MSPESVEAEIASLWVNYRQLEKRLRVLDDLADVNASPLWKRALFVLDGWPLTRVVERPQWRPWHRWWTS